MYIYKCLCLVWSLWFINEPCLNKCNLAWVCTHITLNSIQTHTYIYTHARTNERTHANRHGYVTTWQRVNARTCRSTHMFQIAYTLFIVEYCRLVLANILLKPLSVYHLHISSCLGILFHNFFLFKYVYTCILHIMEEINKLYDIFINV